MRRLPLLFLLPTLLLAATSRSAGDPVDPPTPQPPDEGQALLALQSPELVERLLSEKVVLLPSENGTQAAGRVDALVLFARPLPTVMEHLIDAARQPEYRPELDEMRLVEQSGEERVYEYHLRMMLMRVDYRLRHHWDWEGRAVWWDLDPRFENDVRALEGRWELHPYGEKRTLAEFSHRLVLGPAMPAFLAELGTRVKLPEAMHNVRRWIDSGGTYRP